MTKSPHIRTSARPLALLTLLAALTTPVFAQSRSSATSESPPTAAQPAIEDAYDRLVRLERVIQVHSAAPCLVSPVLDDGVKFDWSANAQGWLDFVVSKVNPLSRAAQAGVKVGDILVAVESTPLKEWVSKLSMGGHLETALRNNPKFSRKDVDIRLSNAALSELPAAAYRLWTLSRANGSGPMRTYTINIDPKPVCLSSINPYGGSDKNKVFSISDARTYVNPEHISQLSDAEVSALIAWQMGALAMRFESFAYAIARKNRGFDMSGRDFERADFMALLLLQRAQISMQAYPTFWEKVHAIEAPSQQGFFAAMSAVGVPISLPWNDQRKARLTDMIAKIEGGRVQELIPSLGFDNIPLEQAAADTRIDTSKAGTDIAIAITPFTGAENAQSMAAQYASFSATEATAQPGRSISSTFKMIVADLESRTVTSYLTISPTSRQLPTCKIAANCIVLAVRDYSTGQVKPEVIGSLKVNERPFTVEFRQ